MSKRATFFGAILGLLLFPVPSFARQGTPPLSRRERVQPVAMVRQIVAPSTDPLSELALDARAGSTTPVRFAVPTAVQITPATDGTWEQVAGGRLWRLRVASAGATDLNFGFTTCWLPEGATLHIYSQDEDYFQGPYSARDNKAHEQLWTPVLPGSRAIIELFVPAGAREEPRLVLAQINRGYRDMFHRQKDLTVAKAGSCNNDVACPQAGSWRNEIRSVARYTVNGNSLCTGTLINNASNDLKNYFLTATHCTVSAGNAASVVVYWNFQSPTCGQHGGGSLAQNQSGAIFRMSKSDVDVTLIELDDIPDSNYHVYYSGWDRSGVAPLGAVGIHHPDGSEKSISFASTTLTTVDNCIGTGTLTHWQVIWDSGVTEPGSSGSGIWDPNTHRLVGTLSGGDSACDAPQGPDCYGKFSLAWNLGATAATRLRDWLDPANTGIANVPGRDPNPLPVIIAANSSLVSENCAPGNGIIDPGETVTLSLALQNLGSSNSVNLIASLLTTNGVTSPDGPQSYGVVVAGGAPTARNFSFVASGSCGSVITPTLQLQDGTNNLGLVSFTFRAGSPLVIFTQKFDTVAVPTLPAGWSSSASGSAGWSTTSSASHTAPNAVFATDPGVLSDATLTSPSIAISTAVAQLTFAHYYNTESGSEPFDGGVLEISYNNGPFNDVITAGGSFASGGYNGTISTRYNSPIAGRTAWSGNSGTFVITVVNLPITAAGQNVRLRWRMASDTSTSGTGWYVDSISVSDGYTCCQGLVAPRIVEARQTNNSIVFSFNTVLGQTYITEYKNSVTTNVAWTALQTNAGDGAKKSVTNALVPGTNRFFRVQTH